MKKFKIICDGHGRLQIFLSLIWPKHPEVSVNYMLAYNCTGKLLNYRIEQNKNRSLTLVQAPLEEEEK